MKIKHVITALILMTFVASALYGAESRNNNRRSFTKTTIIGDTVHMAINNLDLPIENEGSSGFGGNGIYPKGSGLSFLFEGGIATSAFVNGELRASWMAKASRITEFQPGRWGDDPDDARARLYVVRDTDAQGSDAYIQWADAVALGADFQDLDGDGQYDPNVDRPDMIGNRIIWCVYNDGVALSERALSTPPMGLEVQQQAWAFNRSDELGDVIFFRYRFVNKGDADIDDLIFTIWDDPDLGDYQDDLIGNDTTLSLGFIYNDGDDNNYGPNPPAFGVDFFQGPVVDSPGDTAFTFRGPFFGVDTLLNKKNLPMTSFMFYIQSDPVIGDPDLAVEARAYQTGGLDKQGNPLIYQNFGNGNELTVVPNTRFIFSGDPNDQAGIQAGTEWLDITPDDKRFMVNSGPFQLPKDEAPKDVVIGYIVSQASSALSSLAKLKRTDVIAQTAYDANFFVAGPPPPPAVNVRTFDKKIEFIIDMASTGTFAYDQSDRLLNRQVFEGINIFQYRSNSNQKTVNNLPNEKLIATFDVDNEFDNIYQNVNGELLRIRDGVNNLDPALFVDEGSAILRVVVDKDAFNNDQPLVNNRDYYFSITSFSLNQPFLVDDTLNITGDPAAKIGTLSGVLLENNRTVFSARPQSDELAPFRPQVEADYVGSRARHDGRVFVDPAIKADLKNADYEVGFFDDGTHWFLRNVTSNTVVLDSMRFQGTDESQWNYPLVEGLSVKVLTVEDRLDSAVTTDTTGGGVAWLTGNRQAGFPVETATFNEGIDFVKNAKPLFGGVKKEKYFPVEIEVAGDPATELSMGYHFLGQNFNVFRDPKPIPIRAFDVSDPQNPRQVNIAYISTITGDINFGVAFRMVIFASDYAPSGAYSSVDSTFKADAYLFAALIPTADSLLYANPLKISVTTNFPNSDLDRYAFSSQSLSPDLSATERKDLLANVRVVPNPYFAFSAYETSFDTPILKFTHLDQKATVRIFNLAGQQVRILRKDNTENELQWDLRNSTGLKVASGMYIAHIEVPGVGEKVLKFAIVQREERIDRF